MLRLYWNDALISLVTFLGPQNVFVSIVESGSLDDTKGALRDLEGQLKILGAETRIELSEDARAQIESLKHVPGDKKGWLYTARQRANAGPKFGNEWRDVGDGGWEKRRIPHLADLRNQAMEPLLLQKGRFDRVLWINDVVFTVGYGHVLYKKKDIDADSNRMRMWRHCWQREMGTMLLFVRWISQLAQIFSEYPPTPLNQYL